MAIFQPFFVPRPTAAGPKIAKPKVTGVQGRRGTAHFLRGDVHALCRDTAFVCCVVLGCDGGPRPHPRRAGQSTGAGDEGACCAPRPRSSPYRC